LILDEPTNGLDPIGIKEIRSLILSLAKDRNITIFVSSHILSEIEQLATHMGIIHEGRLLEEIAFDKLRERNRNYLEFQVSDDNKYKRGRGRGLLYKVSWGWCNWLVYYLLNF